MNYIHGYSDSEQTRLIQQAQYWRDKLILQDLNYQPGERLLEIGCGAGAVLGILGRAFPDLQLAGIDLEHKQIDYAQNYLSSLDLDNVDLRVGDATRLPWQDSYFDRLYAMWFLEHLPNPLEVLQEARRVLIKLKITSQQRAIVRIRDAYPPEFTADRDTIEIDLPANSVSESTYTIHPHSRGAYQWGDLQVRQLGKLGLAWRDWISAPQQVTVYLDLIRLRELSIRLTLENSGAMRQARRIGNGTEFAELREYRTGEDICLIDWKATARRVAEPCRQAYHPVVGVLEPEQEQTLFVLLDRGRLMTAKEMALNGLTGV